MDVSDIDGNILKNEKDVLERWQLDFKKLYNGGTSNKFDNDH